MAWGLLISAAISVALFIVQYAMRPKPPKPLGKQGLRPDIPTVDEGTPVPMIYGTDFIRQPGLAWYGEIQVRQAGVTGDSFSWEWSQYSALLHFVVALSGQNVASKAYKRILLSEKELWSGTQTTSTASEAAGELVPSGSIQFWGPETDGLDGDPTAGFVEGRIGFSMGNAVEELTLYGNALYTAINAAESTTYNVDHHQFMNVVFSRPSVPAGTRHFDWGSSPQPPPVAFEIEMIPSPLGVGDVDGATGPDANPAEVLYDLLTNNWGGCELQTELIDLVTFTAAANTLDTEAHGISIVIEQATEASQVVELILDQIDGVLFWDPFDGLLKLKLIRNDWSVDDLPALDESQILRVENYKTTLWDETYNQVRVKFYDRDRDYAESTVLASDQANQYVQNKLRATTLEFPGVKDSALAALIAARELRTMSTPQTQANLVCKRGVASALRPGDCFIWYWEAYGHGFELSSPGTTTGKVMRVEAINYGKPGDDSVKIQCYMEPYAAITPSVMVQAG